MPNFYYTYDYDHNYIQESANIYKIQTDNEGAFIEALINEIKENNEYATHIFIDTNADFSDCWLKYNKPPTQDDFHSPFEWDEIRVDKPGMHPGGNCYWLTPTTSVAAVFTLDKDEYEEDDWQEILNNNKDFEVFDLKMALNGKDN